MPPARIESSACARLGFGQITNSIRANQIPGTRRIRGQRAAGGVHGARDCADCMLSPERALRMRANQGAEAARRGGSRLRLLLAFDLAGRLKFSPLGCPGAKLHWTAEGRSGLDRGQFGGRSVVRRARPATEVYRCVRALSDSLGGSQALDNT